jgi:hypothetical protein
MPVSCRGRVRPAAAECGVVAAEVLISIASWYAGLGAAVAALFLAVGLNRIDPAGHGSYLFRVLLVPGLVLLWPIVLLRWLQLERGRHG